MKPDDEIQISDEIPKEDCLNAANSLIEDLKKEIKALKEDNQKLSAERRDAEMKAEELRRKRDKIWGFSFDHLVATMTTLTILVGTIVYHFIYSDSIGGVL